MTARRRTGVFCMCMAVCAVAACGGRSSEHPSDAGSLSDAATDASVAGDGSVVSATNPVLGVDHPDPHVVRVVDGDGKPVYYLTATVHNAGDVPVYRSRDLVSWELASPGLFGRTSVAGDSIELNGFHYCSIWAPQIVEIGASAYQLSFSAQRFAKPQRPCPPYTEDGGVYLASAASPLGPFAPASRPWEPLVAGAHPSCPSTIADALPHSVNVAATSCQGMSCSDIIRLDSDVFRDPVDGRWWLAYSWYTNLPPLVQWEFDNHGEHVSVVELDPSDPFVVRCDAAVAEVFVGHAHDAIMLTVLASDCPRCGETLSMSKGRQDEDMQRNGYSWAINEGANMFRRGDYVYMLMNGSAWDSAYYHYFWVAAPTVEQLAYDNPARLSGRLLIPSQGMSFGHGSVTLGPDGVTMYLVHHRLDHTACKQSGNCARDVWLTELAFESQADGLGPVHLVPQFPAEQPAVHVTVP